MIGTNEAAKKLGISKTRLRKLCNEGRIIPEPEMIGNQWIFADNFKVVQAAKKCPGKIKMVEPPKI